MSIITARLAAEEASDNGAADLRVRWGREGGAAGPVRPLAFPVTPRLNKKKQWHIN